jgi:hypothetical protein
MRQQILQLRYSQSNYVHYIILLSAPNKCRNGSFHSYDESVIPISSW